jgi:WD40 repeat protein
MRLHKKRNRRRTILKWTAMIQISVLLGVTLFVATTWFLAEKTTTSPVAVNTKTNINETPIGVVSPIIILPPPAEAETTTGTNNVTVPEPFESIVEPIFAVSPHETTPATLPHPATAPSLLAVTTEHPHEATTPSSPLQVETTVLESADELLESAKNLLPTDPEKSVEQAVRAVKMYDQQGQPYPDSTYWILGNAFASLTWGEPLLESSPAIETMALSPDSRYLLAQLKDKTVWCWDLQHPESERARYLLEQGTAEYVKFVFAPDSRWIFGGQKNGTIRIWDMTLKNPAETVITFMERLPDLQDIQISPNGQWLAAFGNSSKGVVIAENHPNAHSNGQPIQQVAYQRERFGSETLSYPVLLWNLRQMETGIVPTAVSAPSAPLPAQVIRFSPNSDRLAIARRDAAVYVYDLTVRGVKEEPFVLRGHQFGITQMAFAPSGQWLATGSQDNTVRLWNLTGSKSTPESVTLYGHVGWISALTVDTMGENIFSGSYDRTIRVWHIQGDRIGSVLNTEPIVMETRLGVPVSLSVTEETDKMIIRGDEGSLGIYHLPSLLGGAAEEDVQAVTFRNSKLSISHCLLTPNDQLLIFSYEHLSKSSNNGIRLWPLQPQPFTEWSP